MRKLNFWDYLFYTSMSVVMLWVILKSIGVIQTPFWLQYGLPVGGFVLGVFALYYNLLNNIMNINVKVGGVEKDTHILKDDVKEVKSKVNNLELKINQIESNTTCIDKRLINVEMKMA